MSGVLGQLKKTLEEHERQEKRLGNKATLTTLKAGPTEAVAIVGEPPEPYLEALLEGVTESFIATVRVHDDVLPKRLLARGADVRVGPPPRVDDGYQITAYQPDGTVNVVCRANEPERKTWDPERPESRGPLKLSLRDFAPFDSESVTASLDALPQPKRKALERRVYRSPGVLLLEVTLLMSLSYALPLVGLLMVLVGFALLIRQAVLEGSFLAPFLLTSAGTLMVICGRMVNQRIDSLIGSGKDLEL